MSSQTSSIAAIDFSNPDRQANAKLLVQAMETAGFVYLDNVPGYDSSVEEKLLKACKWFYDKPLQEKIGVSNKNWNKDAPGVFRGYIPIGREAGILNEQYKVGITLPEDDPDRNSANYLYEPTPWPGGEGAESFRAIMEAHYAAMNNAGMEFLRLCAMGLGLEENYFDEKFLPKPVSTLGINHNPPYGNTEQPTFSTEEHFDSSFVTLLVTYNFDGLEILNEKEEWVPVAPRPGSLIVNIGDLLSRMTKRILRATVHRVRDLGGHRYSVPFFLEPRADSQFFSTDDEFGLITYGPWLVNHLKKQFVYQFGYLPEYPNIPMIG